MNSRIRAFAIHLSLSLLVLTLAAAWVFFVWYPYPLSIAVGVGSIFLLVALCDAILGPLLTLLIYKKGKNKLAFDLAIIAVVQVSALLFGLWTMALGRPVWLVFNVDRFDLVQSQDLDIRYIGDAKNAFKSAPKTGPKWVASRTPADTKRRNQLLTESVMGGSDLPQRIDFYVDISEEAAAISSKSFALEELNKNNESTEVKSELAKWPQASRWLPLMARSKPMVVLVDKLNSPVAVVNLNPWP